MTTMENRDALESAINDAHRLTFAAYAILQPLLTGAANSRADQVETLLVKITDELATAIQAFGGNQPKAA